MLFPLRVFTTTPRRQDEIVLFQVRDKVFPLRDPNNVCVAIFLGLGKHIGLDFIEFGYESCAQTFNGGIPRFAIVTQDDTSLFAFDVARTNFDTNRNTALLPVIVLPTRVVNSAIVILGTHATGHQILQNGFTVRIGFFGHEFFADNRDDHSMQRSDTRRQHQTFVITVHHDHYTDSAGCQTPRSLPRGFRHTLFILEGDTKHFTKVLSQMMRRGSLNGTARTGNVRFYRCRTETTSKLIQKRNERTQH
mmetsp:Transcript_19026/g.38428  ORF Transcript_19026/g.38428 Transcript_19026/m.38428 type:complete len:249 (-) Transcript_19026:2292-3038(-)